MMKTQTPWHMFKVSVKTINFALSSLELDPRWMVFTDTLNMCQGVWVFIIFVCKKNVYNVVTGKWKNLYNTIAKQMSTKTNSKFLLLLCLPMKT
jgi:hypothetical protein